MACFLCVRLFLCVSLEDFKLYFYEQWPQISHVWVYVAAVNYTQQIFPALASEHIQ